MADLAFWNHGADVLDQDLNEASSAMVIQSLTSFGPDPNAMVPSRVMTITLSGGVAGAVDEVFEIVEANRIIDVGGPQIQMRASTRALEGTTTPVTWPAGTRVEMRVTAGVLLKIQSEIAANKTDAAQFQIDLDALDARVAALENP